MTRCTPRRIGPRAAHFAVIGVLLASAQAAGQQPATGADAVRSAPAPQVQLQGGPWAGAYQVPPSATVCTQGMSGPKRWDVLAAEDRRGLSLQLTADLPQQGGSTDQLLAVLSVGAMNVQTGENPPDGIYTLDGQRGGGSGTLTIRRMAGGAVVTVTGRTAAWAQIQATLRCGELIER